MKNWTLMLCILLVNVGVPLAAAENTYTNPIVASGADPAILIYKDTYYCYTTTGQRNVLLSKDLVHWEEGPVVIPEHLKGCWAPEVYYHPEDGKFYMYYTMRYKIGVAVSDSPDSMFSDLGFLAIPAIDAHLFRDDDKRLYLYFTVTPNFQIYCLPMKSPTQPCGPVSYLFQAYQDWELKHPPQHINEGPQMFKKDGKYLLYYCGNDGQTADYSMGLAIADSPVGPFVKVPSNPVFAARPPEINAPGHGFISHDRRGDLWFVYHQKPTTERGWKRDLCIDRLEFTDEFLLTGYPTRHKEMSAPICDEDLVWAPDVFPREKYFSQLLSVSLSSETADAEIRYTLDGSEPTQESILYTGPFDISKSLTLQVAAFKLGMRSSQTVKREFVLDPSFLKETPVFRELGIEPFAVFPEPVTDLSDKDLLYLQTNEAYIVEHLRKDLDEAKIPYLFYENPYQLGDRYLFYVKQDVGKAFNELRKKWQANFAAQVP